MSSRIIRYRLEHSSHSTLCNVLAEGVFGFNLWGWNYQDVRESIVPLTMELLLRNEGVQYVSGSHFDEDKFENGEWTPVRFAESPLKFGPLPISVKGSFKEYRPAARGKLDKKAVTYYIPEKPDPGGLPSNPFMSDWVYLNRFITFMSLPTEGSESPRPN